MLCTAPSADRGSVASELIRVAPSFTSVLRYLAMPEMTAALGRLVQVSALPLVGLEVDFAADSTRFSSDLLGRRQDHKWKRGRRDTDGRSLHRTWVKLHLWTGVATNVTTVGLVSSAYSHDTNYFVPMLHTRRGDPSAQLWRTTWLRNPTTHRYERDGPAARCSPYIPG